MHSLSGNRIESVSQPESNPGTAPGPAYSSALKIRKPAHRTKSTSSAWHIGSMVLQIKELTKFGRIPTMD